MVTMRYGLKTPLLSNTPLEHVIDDNATLATNIATAMLGNVKLRCETRNDEHLARTLQIWKQQHATNICVRSASDTEDTTDVLTVSTEDDEENTTMTTTNGNSNSHNAPTDVLAMPVLNTAQTPSFKTMQQVQDEKPVISQEQIDALRTLEQKSIGTRYDEVETTEVEYLWSGYLPMKPTLITGKAGCKKSWLATYFASVVSSGGIWPDGTQATKGGVVLITPEDGASDTVAYRLKSLGADMSNILDLTLVERSDVVLNAPTVTPFSLPRDFDILEQAIRYISATLVVIDPILAVTGRIGRNEDTCRNLIMTPLNNMCDRLGVCVLMLNHLTKGYYNPKNIETQISGAFHNASRVSYIAEKDVEREGVSVVKQFKNNIHETMPPLSYRIAKDATGKPLVEFLNARNVSMLDKIKSSNISELRQNILTLLYTRGYPMTPSAIAQQLDVNAVTVRVEMRRMLERKELQQSMHGLYEIA